MYMKNADEGTYYTRWQSLYVYIKYYDASYKRRKTNFGLSVDTLLRCNGLYRQQA